jgi:O-antigen/teichoic acid export membrane protein
MEASEVTSLRQSFIFNSAYQVLIILIPLITVPYVARVLGAHNIGIYVFYYNIAYYFSLFAMLGIKNYGVRCVAKVRDDKRALSKVFWELYVFQFAAAVIMTALYSVYIVLFVRGNQLVAVISVLYVLASAIDVSWFFFGLEEFRTTALRGMSIRVLTFVSIFVFVKSADDLWKYVLILAVGAFLSPSVLLFLLKNRVSFIRPSFYGVIQHFMPNFLLFLPTVAVSIYTSMNQILLGTMSDMSQVGYYSNSQKIITIPYSLITALGTVMIARMSYLRVAGSREQSQRYVRYSLSFACMLSCAMAFGVGAIAPTFIPIFLGAGYGVCVPLTIAIAPSILFMAWNNVLRTQILIPSGRDKGFVMMTVIGAVVNLALNLALIGNMKAMGAVIASDAAELVVAVYITYLLRSEISTAKCLKDNIVYVFIGFLMLGAVRLVAKMFESIILSLIAQVIVGVLVFVVLSAVYLRRYNKPLYMTYIKQIPGLSKVFHVG